MGGLHFSYITYWVLVNYCFGSSTLPGYESRGQDIWPWRKKESVFCIETKAVVPLTEYFLNKQLSRG